MDIVASLLILHKKKDGCTSIRHIVNFSFFFFSFQANIFELSSFENYFSCYAIVMHCIIWQTNAFPYPSNGDVVVLTPSNFDRLVVESDEVWVVHVSKSFSIFEFNRI